jgi:hypothetical protein
VIAPLRFSSSLLLLTFVAAASAADAARPRFIVPDRFAAAAHDAVRLSFRSPSDGKFEPIAWPVVDRLFIRADGGQKNRHDVTPSQPDGDGLTLVLTTRGANLVGADIRDAVERIPAAELRTLLERAGGKIAATIPDAGEIRVRFVRSAATLLRVSSGDAPREPSAVATSKTGQKAEIRPLMDPTTAAVGSDLPFRVYVDGSKVEGVKVRATIAEATAVERTTDAGGSLFFPVSAAGVWRLEFAHAKPLERDDAADWAVYVGTITFEVPPAGGRK